MYDADTRVQCAFRVIYHRFQQMIVNLTDVMTNTQIYVILCANTLRRYILLTVDGQRGFSLLGTHVVLSITHVQSFVLGHHVNDP